MRPLLCLLLGVISQAARGAEVLARNDTELRAAVRMLQPGTTLKIAPGDYTGGHTVAGVEKLTVEALDRTQPPHFRGGAQAWHFSRCPGLTVRHLRISGQSGNGLNLDDGGELEKPVVGISLEDLEISDIGPKGNHDAIKCSGIQDLAIRGCRITGWGGQGIDCVGCHRVRITDCRFTGKEGFSASAAVQLKGGTSESVVEKCQFTNAGERPVNVGGSTGLEFFRPQGVKHEASKIVVRANVIEGSLCAVAFVGVDGAEFSENTVLFPQKWIFRMLQENTAPGFVPCRNVLVKDNRIVFRRSQVQVEVNVGGGTAPDTLRFEGNRWFAEDRPASSKPRLPVEEASGIYGTDPR